MSDLFVQAAGSTPLTPEEQDDLIPSLLTRDELNEWERLNILEAHAWALDSRRLRRSDPLDESYVSELHRRMFDQTWRWAGRYRTTKKNIGVAYYQIREELGMLLGNARYWQQHGAIQQMSYPSACIIGWYGFMPSPMAMPGLPEP